MCSKLYKLIEYIFEVIATCLRPVKNCLEKVCIMIFEVLSACCSALVNHILIPIYECLAKVCGKIFYCFKGAC